MTDIAKLTVGLYANSAQFVSELNKSRKQATKWGADVGQSFVSGAKTVATSSLAIAGSAAAIGYAVKASLDNIDEMTRLAGNLSIPVERFQELSYAAKLSGSEMDKVADVIKDISVRVQDAAFSGGGPMVDFFTQINQKASDWAQLRPDQQFERFVAEINKMDANQARFWLDEINDSATELFGVLYGSGAAFGKFESEARGVGLAVSTDMTGNVKEARVEFDRLLQLGSATWKNVIAASSPAFTYVIKGINQWIVGAAKAEGGFANLGNALALSIVRGAQLATKSIETLINETIDGYNAVAKYVGLDIEPKSVQSLKAQIKYWEGLQHSIEQTEGVYRDSGQQDIPGWIELPPEAQKRYDELTAKIFKAQAAMKGHVDFSGLIGDLKTVEDVIARTASKAGNIGKVGQVDVPDVPSAPKNRPSIQATQALAELKKNLQTQREQVEATYQSQLQTISNYYGSEVDTSKEAKSLIEKAEAQHQKALADLEKNGPFGQLQASLMTQQQAIQQSYDARLKIIKDHYGAQFDSSKEAADLVVKLEKDKNTKLKEADEQRIKESGTFWEQMKMHIQNTASDFDTMWGNVFNRFSAGIGDAVSGAIFQQQSWADANRDMWRNILQTTVSSLLQIGIQELALWALRKAIGGEEKKEKEQSILATTYDAAMKAYDSMASIPYVGPVLGAAAFAGTMALGLGAAATVGGMAHDGIDRIPSEGTWLLDKGERVYTNDSANRIDSMYNRVMSMQQQSAAPALAGGGTTLVQVSTVDAQGFEKMLRRNKRALERQNKRIANDRGRRATARG